MNKKLKVLIPTDFSIQAEYAFILVDKIRQQTELEVHFLYVMNFPDTVIISDMGEITTCGEIDIEYVSVQRDMASKKLRHIQDEYGKDVHTHIRIGATNETIVDFAEKHSFDLIAMGTKGATGFFERLAGSETQIVARKSKVPVLSLMCNRSDLAIKRILLVHQFEDKHHQDLYLLKRFLLNFNAELHLLQISKTGMDAEKIVKNMHDFAKEHGLENIQTHVIKDTDVENGVIHFNQMIDMDLVCIGTYGKGGFFHSSATEKLINHLYKPIISFHLN